MKNFYTLSLIALLTGCGGGSSSADFTPEEQTRLEEIKTNWEGLPNTPEESHPDYHTLKGVDDNSNNIRDDWELANALASYPNKDEFTLLNMIAENHNKIVDAYDAKDDEQLLSEFKKDSLYSFCYSYFKYDNDYLMIEPMRDTNIREKNYNAWGIYMNRLIDEKFNLPTYAVLRTECPKLLEEGQ